MARLSAYSQLTPQALSDDALAEVAAAASGAVEEATPPWELLSPFLRLVSGAVIPMGLAPERVSQLARALRSIPRTLRTKLTGKGSRTEVYDLPAWATPASRGSYFPKAEGEPAKIFLSDLVRHEARGKTSASMRHELEHALQDELPEEYTRLYKSIKPSPKLFPYLRKQYAKEEVPNEVGARIATVASQQSREGFEGLSTPTSEVFTGAMDQYVQLLRQLARRVGRD